MQYNLYGYTMVSINIDQFGLDWIGSRLEKYLKITMNTLKYPSIKLSGNNTSFFKEQTSNLLFTP